MTQSDIKIIELTRGTMIGLIRYNPGEICGFEPRIADILIKENFAVLHGDGKPRKVGERIPDEIGSGNWAGAAVASHIAALKQR
jgi:hypothetical protein